uniref:Uncharacterized protein n=1 Tax=Romanomermis culicivorax TaxID=13658 RepID=A0A915I370_ROMCU
MALNRNWSPVGTPIETALADRTFILTVKIPPNRPAVDSNVENCVAENLSLLMLDWPFRRAVLLQNPCTVNKIVGKQWSASLENLAPTAY